MNEAVEASGPDRAAMARPVRYALWALMGGVAVLLFLYPAIYNGFPITYHDTGGYMDRYFLQSLGNGRSVAYGTFLGLSVEAGTGLWLAVVVQSVVAFWLLARVLQTLHPPAGPLAMLPILLLAVVLTGFPWYTAQAMPDAWTVPLVLAAYLLAFQAPSLCRWERLLLSAVVVFAALIHMAHLALLLGLSICVGALALIGSRRRWVRPPTNLSAVPLVALAIASTVLVPVTNGLWTGTYGFTPGGQSFVFGRLVQDGIVARFLDEHCPSDEYKLCGLRDRVPDTANEWLWAPETPFWEIGGWEGGADEMRRITVESFKAYPWMHVWTAVVATWDQFWTFKTGDELLDWHFHTEERLGVYLPESFDTYSAAPQRQGAIGFDTLNLLHEPAAYVLVLASLALGLWATVTGRGTMAWFLAFVWLALLGNAFICGVLSNPHDRYQSRMIVLAVLGTAAALYSARPNERRQS